MVNKGESSLTSFLPYGKQVMEIAKHFSSTSSPKEPELAAYEKAAIENRILKNIKEKYEYSEEIKKFLLSWAERVYNEGNSNVRMSIISMRCMEEWLVDQSLADSYSEHFNKMVVMWKKIAIVELFTIANVRVTQVCEGGEFGNVYKDNIYRTIFSDHIKSNQEIIGGLIEVGVTVSAGVISTEQFKEYFPACEIVFIGEVKALDEQIQDNYLDEPSGAVHARARKRMLDRDAKARVEKKKELERIKNKKYITVD
jgi:hypothetical protein